MAVPTPAEDGKRVAEAKKIAKENPKEAEAIYKDVLSRNPGTNEAAIRNFETSLISLGELYRDHNRVQDLADLVTQTRSALSSFAKAKTAKLGALTSHGVVVVLTNVCSSATARPLPRYARDDRHSDQCDQVMYRMGSLRTEGFPATELGDQACRAIDEEAVLLRGSEADQQPAP